MIMCSVDFKQILIFENGNMVIIMNLLLDSKSVRVLHSVDGTRDTIQSEYESEAVAGGGTS